MAYLEGKAKEIRAATEARVKLISTSGDKIAEQVDVPIEYAQAAVKRYGQKIVRERINIDNICEKAANQISAESGEKEQENSETEQKETANSEINSDWLNKFVDVSGPVSTDEMQNRLSRILAGEIQQPGSFSVRTLKLVGDLDSAVLSLFQKLCSMAISLEHTAVGRRILDVRVLSLGGNAGANSLSPYGMSFSNLNILHE